VCLHWLGGCRRRKWQNRCARQGIIEIRRAAADWDKWGTDEKWSPKNGAANKKGNLALCSLSSPRLRWAEIEKSSFGEGLLLLLALVCAAQMSIMFISGGKWRWNYTSAVVSTDTDGKVSGSAGRFLITRSAPLLTAPSQLTPYNIERDLLAASNGETMDRAHRSECTQMTKAQTKRLRCYSFHASGIFRITNNLTFNSIKGKIVHENFKSYITFYSSYIKPLGMSII